MYKRIEATLILSGISKKNLAGNLGISYNTLLLKLRGEASFTLDEAFRIKQLLGVPETIEYLFARTSSQQSA